MRRIHQESGAVAIELAIVLPVLLLLVLGIAEFGRAFNAQITLTHAAREGVRVMAISDDRVASETAAEDAAVSLDTTQMNILIEPAEACAADTQVTMTITYELNTITGIAGPFSMTGKGVMSCGG